MVGGPLSFLRLYLAVPNDLGGIFGVFGVGLNQFCDVLKLLIEFCGCHRVHFLTSFRKRLFTSALRVYITTYLCGFQDGNLHK